MATKAAIASATIAQPLSARFETLISASSTTRQHRRLQPEQQALHQRHVAEQQIDRRQRGDDDRAGKHEQQPGDQPAAHAVQQPAGIGRELHRLRSGQQHAVVQRMQEPRLVEPALLVDEDAVHQRDLAGRPAERQQPDPGKDARRLAERDRRARQARAAFMRRPPWPASCGARRWRGGTSHRARRRSACRLRAAADRRSRSPTARARSPAARPTAARGRGARCRRRARCGQDAASAGSAIANSAISVSKRAGLAAMRIMNVLDVERDRAQLFGDVLDPFAPARNETPRADR